MHTSNIGVYRNGFQIRRPKKKCKCNMVNDKRIKACIYANGAFNRMQFLAPVSHSMGCTHKGIVPADSSSSDEDEMYEASPATTSESSESPATAAAVLVFALKGKYKKF